LAIFLEIGVTGITSRPFLGFENPRRRQNRPRDVPGALILQVRKSQSFGWDVAPDSIALDSFLEPEWEVEVEWPQSPNKDPRRESANRRVFGLNGHVRRARDFVVLPRATRPDTLPTRAQKSPAT
jgi:hypothetical protein